MKFHTDAPLILGARVQNLDSTATWPPAFFNLCRCVHVQYEAKEQYRRSEVNPCCEQQRKVLRHSFER
jgi:hypothetical protein